MKLKPGPVVLFAILALSQAMSLSAATVFNAVLNGAQEVPATASTGLGLGRVVLNDAETQVTLTLFFTGLTSPQTDGHYHEGAAGVSGGVIIPIGSTGATSGSFTNFTANITAAQVTQLKAGNLYLNVHSVMFPGGELRGQINAQGDANGDRTLTAGDIFYLINHLFAGGPPPL